MADLPSDLQELMEEHATRAACQMAAIRNYHDGLSASNIRKARYSRYHSYYAPLDGDQWPEDKKERPNKLHITANIIKSFVDVEARILSLLPRITNVPPSKDPDSRKKGEIVEDLMMRYLELSDWEVWMGDWNRLKSLYGIGVLHPYWDEENSRPSVRVVEQPQNLMIGWGASDFSVIDWAIYRYYLSPSEAKRRYPDIIITSPGSGKPLQIQLQGVDHTDPLGQKGLNTGNSLSGGESAVNRVNLQRATTNYEDQQVELWDYWYYDAEGKVYNAVLLQQVVVNGPTYHPEMPRIPYIIAENDHEPGSAEGMSTVEPLLDIQMGLNRVFSHFAQIISDNSGNAYQLTGENADNVPEGLVPKEDEIIGAGSGNQILPIQRSVNNFPMQELIKEYWNAAHRISGLPEIMFGNIPSADTSGRVMAIQIEAGQNRIDSKRRREYTALRDLMLFWGYMLQQKNPKINVTKPAEAQPDANAAEPAPELETFEVSVGDYIKGFERWNIIAPEITPRDSIETGQHVANMVNNKLMPLVEGMDRIGLENPEQMLALIKAERSDARLYPQDVQAYAGVLQLLQAIVAQQQQNAAAAAETAAAAQAPAQAASQAAAPTGFEDQNQPGGIATPPGGAPPPGAPAPGTGEFQALIRQTPGGQSQAMSQIKFGRKF